MPVDAESAAVAGRGSSLCCLLRVACCMLHACEKEEEAGGSGWDARKQKSEFLQRVSITIAKGNSRVLDCIATTQAGNLPPHQTWSLALCTTHALSVT